MTFLVSPETLRRLRKILDSHGRPLADDPRLEVEPWQLAFIEQFRERAYHRIDCRALAILGDPAIYEAWGECAWTARDLFER